MKSPPPASRRNAAEIFAVLARWLVGGLLIYMGLVKVLQPVEFLKLVRQYDLVQTPFLLNSIAAALPWLPPRETWYHSSPCFSTPRMPMWPTALWPQPFMQPEMLRSISPMSCR